MTLNNSTSDKISTYSISEYMHCDSVIIHYFLFREYLVNLPEIYLVSRSELIRIIEYSLFRSKKCITNFRKSYDLHYELMNIHNLLVNFTNLLLVS